jgi:hypothetical protein
MIRVNDMRKNFSNSKYLIVFLLTVLAILIPVASINFVYDPGEIYLQKILQDKYSDIYVNRLLSSSSGLPQFDNERLVKGHLAQRAGEFETIIIGSSHCLQISRLQLPQFRHYFTGRTLNLGVSGFGLEDLMVFSDIILHNQRLPKAFIIELSPWSLKWGMDARYMIYESNLENISKDLGIKVQRVPEPYWQKLLSNIINFEYFQQSLARAFDPTFKVIPDIPLKSLGDGTLFDPEKGYADVSTTLNDGSHLYTKSYLERNVKPEDYLEMMSYKLSGDDYDENAIISFERLIDFIRNKNIKVYFLLTPYTPKYSKLVDHSYLERLARVEMRIKKIAEKKNIKIFGSYDPKMENLSEEDFFDPGHCKVAGLNQIDFSH